MPRVNGEWHLPRRYTAQAEQYRIPVPNPDPHYRPAPWRIQHEHEIQQQPELGAARDVTALLAQPPAQALAGARILSAATGPATAAKFQESESWVIRWSDSNQPGNCGMRVICDISGQLIRSFVGDEGWPRQEIKKFSLRDIWQQLDKKFILHDPVVGQILITDRISDIVSLKAEPKLDDLITYFSAANLIQYILARKYGTVFRGPVTRNPRYTNHIIVSWIWIPNPAWLVKSAPVVYNEPIKYDERTATLAQETEALKVLEHEQWINDNIRWPAPEEVHAPEVPPLEPLPVI